MNAFHNFDRIFCINLKDRPDRRKQAEDEFIKFDVSNVEFIDGVVYNGYKDRRRNACVGNHLAHAECFKRAMESKAKNVLIFEDDVEFFWDKLTVHSIIHSGLQTIHSGWCMLYLGINMDRFSAHKYNPYLARIDGGFSTHAYAVSHFFFEEFYRVNSDEKIHHNDVYYAEHFHSEYPCFVTNPLLAGQRESYSDIMGTMMNSSEMMKQRFRDKLV